ncbi:fumarate hydratase [bacterium]|nr:MAG: fumarate hydratase [bacterium]
MKKITAAKIKKLVADLCLEANFVLRSDVLTKLKAALIKETNKRAKDILKAIIDNARIARIDKLAICQDTGLPVVFVELGQGLKVVGDLKSAINQGVEAGYKKGHLRNSVVYDPLKREGVGHSPVIIHIDIVKGNRLKIALLPKGFGCENKTQLKMFNPTVEVSEIKSFVIDTVKSAGPDACPPYIIGVGIGGTADYACLLAKKALLRPLRHYRLPACRQAGTLRITHYTKLERQLLNEINKLNIGPMGLGGKSTALAVNIETYPTHISGLPVAVNISCHALRSAVKSL